MDHYRDAETPHGDERANDHGLSVIIMTLNEAPVIARAIASVRDFANEVLVIDSGSRDGTREIAAEAGARVVEQPWLGYARQRNRGLDLARWNWCFYMDADEIVDAELAAGIQSALAEDPPATTGFVVKRYNEFLGVPLPYHRNPKKIMSLVRLMHRRHTRYDEAMLVHEEAVPPGERRLLPGKLLHWRCFTLNERFERDVQNSTLEANMMDREGKRWSFARLILKPWARFFWHYLIGGSWRLGVVGIVHAATFAQAEFMRQAKLWELQAAPRQQTPPENEDGSRRRAAGSLAEHDRRVPEAAPGTT